ncbi:hypothetical protein [Flavilitoribacter nigricans]|uniref:Uncharacterized protein n=1 Tax=Flavilitoribacter nigricans (strain ATCC 23147 / DSM 23189 / NBRC 102662 / NCIMB 1420 / SS-2) TaxID=1122177 RepID=A0A2D0NAN4_FLAN2|nr:hypothetical protein [Flavilitoribacter nigricans]PHN05446.1 hypothetical protein CRP01_15730 [Flavilitoribacter nigricans DSM 23189 = NBRC 102662]
MKKIWLILTTSGVITFLLPAALWLQGLIFWEECRLLMALGAVLALVGYWGMKKVKAGGDKNRD